jgi:hypothetical protein
LATLAVAGCRSRPAETSAAASGASVPPATRVDDAAARDVDALGHPDFVTRSRASERLVARGPGSFDALGAAGERTAAAPGGARVAVTEPVLEAILAKEPDARLPAHLDSPWPGVRRAAAEELGRRGGWSVIPRLIDRLEDPSAEVRGAAASSLRRLTNEYFGFRSDAGPSERAALAHRWRAWWSLEGRVRAARGDGTSAG